MTRTAPKIVALLTLAGLTACAGHAGPRWLAPDAAIAPAGSQVGTTWTNAAKTGAGASYEAYVDGRYAGGGPTGEVSRVWFSISDGVLSETMYGLIHEAQIKQLRFAVQTSTGLAIEGTDTTARTEYLHVDDAGRPLSPAYRVTTRDRQGRFEIEKRVFTDPDRQALILRVTVRALEGSVRPFLLLEPHMANTGGGDAGEARQDRLTAHEGDVHLTLKPSVAFDQASVGFLGRSDGLTDLRDGRMDWTYGGLGGRRGAIMLTGALPTVRSGEATYDFTIGFGATAEASEAAAAGTLATGYREVLARFNGEGARVGWEDFLSGLTELPRLREVSTDGGRLLQASALMLKVQEDRTYAGALIASLSNPWGDTVSADEPSTGYKAVWPRDFYQCAMALAALGDRATPMAAFRYLPRVQVGPSTPGNKGVGGWFLQKSEVDGTPEWVGVQLDQTAMPIMLGWKLWRLGWLPEADLAAAYKGMIKPAADFLVDGGVVDLGWNHERITPPFTQQERWEEQAGFSPSTTAATITGLITAAEIADHVGDSASAARYRRAADDYSARMETRMFTTRGALGDGRYYLRIDTDGDPNNDGVIESRNGQPALREDLVLDAGFLEIVRYGVRRADDPYILESLAELDGVDHADPYRVHYSLAPTGVPADGWRRYGGDGYGEDTVSGLGYGAGAQMRAGQRGRIWPLLTGERGHFELALAVQRGLSGPAAIDPIRSRYVRAMELFANDGLLLAEQVWDGVGLANPRGYVPGQGTSSATPLAWSHAEYVKLIRSLADEAVWDFYPPVAHHYGGAARRP